MIRRLFKKKTFNILLINLILPSLVQHTVGYYSNLSVYTCTHCNRESSSLDAISTCCLASFEMGPARHR